MKKIALIVLLLIMSATVVNAASINGDFKGNPIVKVKANGNELKVENTPAIIYNGNTLVPIYMIRQLGATVEWDQKTYSVNVNFDNQGSAKQNKGHLDVIAFTKLVKHTGVKYVSFLSDGDKFHELTYHVDLRLTDIPNRDFDMLMRTSAITEAASTRIVDYQDNEFYVLTDYLRDFYAGEITGDQLSDKYRISYRTLDKQTNQSSGTTNTGSVIKSKIKDTFNGFEEGNIYELDNGQYWKQVDYTYKYAYKYRPEVLIYKDGLYYYMKVDGVDKEAKVELIN